MMTSRMSQPSVPNSLRRFFDRVVHRSFGDLALPPHPPPPAGALPGRRLESGVDVLLEIQRAWDADSPHFNPVRERELRRHIGDYTLFMIGLFRERVEHLSATGYYIREGQRSYRFVSEHDRADARPEARLFRALADRFERDASALTYMRKGYFRSALGTPGLPFF